MFVLDESGSIGPENFDKMKKFVEDVISRFNVIPFGGADFAMVQYSTKPRLVFNLNKSREAKKLHGDVRNLKYLDGSTTNTGFAMQIVQNKVNIY